MKETNKQISINFSILQLWKLITTIENIKI